MQASMWVQRRCFCFSTSSCYQGRPSRCLSGGHNLRRSRYKTSKREDRVAWIVHICRYMHADNQGYSHSAFWRQEHVWTQTLWMWRRGWAGTTSTNFCSPISNKKSHVAESWQGEQEKNGRDARHTCVSHILDFPFHKYLSRVFPPHQTRDNTIQC